MSTIGDEANEPVAFAGARLEPYRHVCAFIDSTDEEYQLFDPFVREAVARGEKLSYIVNPVERRAYMCHFQQLGLDLPRLLEAGQVELRTWPETHLRGGRFDQDAMLALAEAGMRGSPRQRIRMVSDMGWAVDHQSDALIAYEARANEIVAKYQHVVICVYDTAHFGGDIVIDVLRTHPMVLIGGMLYVNPFFVPPAQMLEELRQRGRPRRDG